MPRNQNGTVTRFNNRNYEKDSKPDINAEFNGQILNDDIEDLKVSLQDSIDSKGRGKVQENINFNGNRITNLSKAIEYEDLATLEDFEKYRNISTLLQDDGSNEENAEVKLFIDLDVKFTKGFSFEFIAPFTQTKSNLEKNNRREIFILKSKIDKIEIPVLREGKKDGFWEDYFPSFLKGNTYKYFIDEYQGELCVRWKDNFEISTIQFPIGSITDREKERLITPAGFFAIEERIDYSATLKKSFINLLGYNNVKLTGYYINSQKRLPTVLIRY